MNTSSLSTLALIVRNQPGVLGRISLIFSRRGYNIESLTVSQADDVEIPGYESSAYEFSRMTITCRGDATALAQTVKQLIKLIDVIQAVRTDV